MREASAATARDGALLACSRELVEASDETALADAVARALAALFPGLCACVRLLEPATFALRVHRASGTFRPGACDRVVLTQRTVTEAGLSEAVLVAGGVVIAAEDAPLFEGCKRSIVLPLAAAGELHGLVNLEYPSRSRRDLRRDEPLLARVANQAALALRSLRSVEEVSYLKAFLENLIENANALIAVVNRHREVIVFNRAFARLLGRDRAEVLGEGVSTLLPPNEHALLASLLDRGFNGAPVTGVELKLALRSGGQARVLVNTSTIYGASGEVEGVMIVGQDHTLLRALQDRAEHAQKLAELGRLAAGIVHELNNPLTAVTAYTEALLGKLALSGHDPADVEKLRRIHEAGQRIQRFSRDLITYARPSQDAFELVEMDKVLIQATQMCEPTLRAAKAEVEQRFESVSPVWGMRGSLLQVFVNLLTNAAHALEPKGGTITLELAPAGDHVVVRVKDDGPGMAPEVRRRAFEPFFTTKADGKGSGLGLSIVQGIVSRHAGVVSLESEPDAGTAFTVLLPTKPALP